MIYIENAMAHWQGRVDSNDDFDAFRWHQWVQSLDLNDPEALATLEHKGFSIGFIGFPCDEGIKRNKGRIGASRGPEQIRRELSSLPCWFGKNLKLYDCGDVIVMPDDLNTSQERLAEAVQLMVKNDIFPIVMGGGHELAWGHFSGLSKKYTNLSCFNFDAHFDMRPYGELTSSGTMFRQIADACESLGKPFHYYAYGIQKRGNTLSLFKEALQKNVIYSLAVDIKEEKSDSLKMQSVERKLNTFISESEQIYVTLCTDVISSAYAPGVSAAQPLGLDPENIIYTLKKLLASGKVVGFDVAEVSPRYDVDNSTANVVATVIFACVNTLASVYGVTHPDIEMMKMIR